MKNSFITSLILILIFSLNCVVAQTGSLSIKQTNNGSIIDVSILLVRTGAIQWNLGYASLVFNYNYNAMNTPSEIAEGLWDDNSNPNYDDQIISLYNGNKCVSVEIGLNNLSTGTAVPADTTLVGKIRFNISNPSQFHDITWNTLYSSVLDNNGNDITSGITFNNPQNALLPVELTSFSSNVIENNVYLHWTTSSELNNYGFEVYRKISGDNQWQLTGFVPGNINSHELNNYDFADKNLLTGTYNYRLKQLDLNGNWTYFELNNSVDINLPDLFRLSQNFPNPFNPNTVIKFNNPVSGNVKLTVYDLSGKQIKVLLDEYKQAGYYSVNFNGAGLSSGIYVYELNNGREKLVKFMSLVK